MNTQDFSKYKTLFIVLAVIIALLEIPGALDLRNRTYSGYWTDGNNTVIKVFPNSPAEKAGFKVGDVMKSNGGIDVTDTKAFARRSRAKVSETRTYVFDRDGETVSLDLVFSGMPVKNVVLSFAGTIIGFCFLIFGLWAYLKIQTKATTLLAAVGICLGFNFVDIPYIASYTFRMIFASIANVIVIFSLAFLLHFLMVFPKTKAMLEKKSTKILLYIPACLIALFILFLILIQPESTSGLNTLVNILLGLFIAGYLGSSAVALIHSYVKATSEEREAFGLKFMFFGTIIGLAPVIISAIIGIIAPKLVLPGVEFYFLTMVLIPISLALACVKSEQ